MSTFKISDAQAIIAAANLTTPLMVWDRKDDTFAQSTGHWLEAPYTMIAQAGNFALLYRAPKSNWDPGLSEPARYFVEYGFARVGECRPGRRWHAARKELTALIHALDAAEGRQMLRSTMGRFSSSTSRNIACGEVMLVDVDRHAWDGSVERTFTAVRVGRGSRYATAGRDYTECADVDAARALFARRVAECSGDDADRIELEAKRLDLSARATEAGERAAEAGALVAHWQGNVDTHQATVDSHQGADGSIRNWVLQGLRYSTEERDRHQATRSQATLDLMAAEDALAALDAPEDAPEEPFLLPPLDSLPRAIQEAARRSEPSSKEETRRLVTLCWRHSLTVSQMMTALLARPGITQGMREVVPGLVPWINREGWRCDRGREVIAAYFSLLGMGKRMFHQLVDSRMRHSRAPLHSPERSDRYHALLLRLVAVNGTESDARRSRRMEAGARRANALYAAPGACQVAFVGHWTWDSHKPKALRNVEGGACAASADGPCDDTPGTEATQSAWLGFLAA
jgi:hypothetical protein